MNLLEVGLDYWILDDGNYLDFEVGQTRSFALEFYNKSGAYREVSERSFFPSLSPLADANYRVAGRTIHRADDWCVVDIGVLAFRDLMGEAPPPKQFTGELRLGVDPFFYFEGLGRREGAPALIYDWRIHKIEVETAPRVLRDGMWMYDPTDRRPKEVPSTAGEGDTYLLHCERLQTPPRNQL
jgi:hypothetical protein